MMLYGVMKAAYNLKRIASIVAEKRENHQETNPGNLLNVHHYIIFIYSQLQ